MPINPVTSGMAGDKEFLARKLNEIIGHVNKLNADADAALGPRHPADMPPAAEAETPAAGKDD